MNAVSYPALASFAVISLRSPSGVIGHEGTRMLSPNCSQFNGLAQCSPSRRMGRRKQWISGDTERTPCSIHRATAMSSSSEPFQATAKRSGARKRTCTSACPLSSLWKGGNTIQWRIPNSVAASFKLPALSIPFSSSTRRVENAIPSGPATRLPWAIRMEVSRPGLADIFENKASSRRRPCPAFSE